RRAHSTGQDAAIAATNLTEPAKRALSPAREAPLRPSGKKGGPIARKFGAVRRRGAGRCNPRHGKTRTWPRRDRHCIALRTEPALSISEPPPPFPRLACPSPRNLDRLLPARFAAAHRLTGCSAHTCRAFRCP